jgi:hypothetical protein
VGDAQRYEFRVCDASPGVPWPLWQGIVSCDIDCGQRQVEVGVDQGVLGFGDVFRVPSTSTVLAINPLVSQAIRLWDRSSRSTG